MSRLESMRSDLNQRGKSIVGYGADLLEWSLEKNLAVAADIASFAVAQIRLSIEVQNFAEYWAEVRGSTSGFGETLKEHGQDCIAKLGELPGEFRNAVTLDNVQAAPVATRKKAAAKKAA